MDGLPRSRLLPRRIVGLPNGSEAHRPAFPGEQGSAEGVRGVGVEGAEPAELVPGGGEVAESGLRDDKGDPGLDERDVESERGPGGPGRLGPSARLGVEDGQPAGVIGTVRVDRGGAAEEGDGLISSPRGPGQRGRPFQEPLVVSLEGHPGPEGVAGLGGTAAHPEEVRLRLQRGHVVGPLGEGRVEQDRGPPRQVGRAALPPPFAGGVEQGDPEVPVGLHTGRPTGPARPDPFDRVGPRAATREGVGSRGGRRRARDAVISHRRVSDVSGPAPGHVAVDATVVGLAGAAVGLGDAAGPGLVAGEAARAVVLDPLGRPRAAVRVVAGRAAEGAAAGGVAAAGVHLLDLADGPGAAGRPRLDEDRDELVEREPRAEVPLLVAGPEEAVGPLEVALLADRLAGRRGQVAGIDDRRVEASGAYARPADVQGAGAVAPLAADRPEVQRGRIAVEGAPGRRRAVDVAGQAAGRMTRSKWKFRSW